MTKYNEAILGRVLIIMSKVIRREIPKNEPNILLKTHEVFKGFSIGNCKRPKNYQKY